MAKIQIEEGVAKGNNSLVFKTHIITMSSFGVINHMVITMRNNLNLLRKKKNFKKGADFYIPENANYKVNERGIASEPISKEELLTIRRKIQTQNRKYWKRMALYLLIAFPLCALLLYYVFKDYPLGVGDVATSGLIDRTMIEKEKRSKFLFFLTDGDEWLKKKNYHNAVFQYKKALEIYPSEYSAYYRLANAYTYQCQYNFKGCDEGHKLVKKLKNQYSGSTGLQKMEEVFKHWGIP